MMIESRYKIEYIFPDTETKKTSSFRGLFLLPLIPLLVLILLDFTNDYTFEDLAEDSSSLIENVKTNILNLGGNSLIQNTKSENLKKTAPMINIAEPNNEDKALISKLQKKEKAQSESIQTEIAKNDKLTKELTELSKQLTLEKEKNQKLNIQLAEQKHSPC